MEEIPTDLLVQERLSLLKLWDRLLVDKSWCSIAMKVLITKPWDASLSASLSAELGAVSMSSTDC